MYEQILDLEKKLYSFNAGRVIGRAIVQLFVCTGSGFTQHMTCLLCVAFSVIVHLLQWLGYVILALWLLFLISLLATTVS